RSFLRHGGWQWVLRVGDVDAGRFVVGVGGRAGIDEVVRAGRGRQVVVGRIRGKQVFGVGWFGVGEGDDVEEQDGWGLVVGDGVGVAGEQVGGAGHDLVGIAS